MGQNGNAAGADLVGGVAVGGDPVAAHKAGVDLALCHHQRGHVVADQGHIHTGFIQLIGGEPGTLEQRTGLVGVDVEAIALLLPQQNRAKGGAVDRGGKGPGIAVGQQAEAGLQERKPVLGDLQVHLDVFLLNANGLLPQGVQQLRPGLVMVKPGSAEHPLQSPAEVHCGGAALLQIFGLFLQSGVEMGKVRCGDASCQYIQGVACKDADGRGAPNPQGEDGFIELVPVF